MSTATPVPEDGHGGVSGDFDAIVVGAGFSGISALHKLRELGLKVQVFEEGTDFGGVWYWNRYPGARVDSECPFYQLNIPEVWKTWNWSVRFPDHKELREYMAHIDKTLGLRKDVAFNSRVNDARFNTETGRWTVKTVAGHTSTAKYLILATGLLHRRHYPDFPGLSDYKGVVHHSGFWPEGTSVKGKKVAIIGAGATSVQIVQELAKEADSLSMYMRRPSYCLPMGQRKITTQEQDGWRPYYPLLFQAGRNSRAGFPVSRQDKSVFDVTPEEREAHYQEAWAAGAFNFNMTNYNDIVLDTKANRIAYDFWAKKIRARFTDPVKRDMMAPLEPPYWFGTKRCPLEHDYYEMLDKPTVDIVDLTKTPFKQFDATGVTTSDGVHHDYDVIVLATGFDSFTGSLTSLGIKNKDGVDIKDCWKDGVHTYLGMQVSGFPNMFMVYSPQAPTAFSNGPTILETQVDFLVDAIVKLEKEKAKTIEPQEKAEEAWAEIIEAGNAATLFPLTNSWWNASNIPGKKAQSLTYVYGIDTYEKVCREKMTDWQGYNVVSA